jgi:hypothetical protein
MTLGSGGVRGVRFDFGLAGRAGVAARTRRRAIVPREALPGIPDLD